jgi:TusA-related sulfurtransferase
MSVKMKTTVYKWENGKVIEVNARDEINSINISEEVRKQNYERSRDESIKEKKK